MQASTAALWLVPETTIKAAAVINAQAMASKLIQV
jgi:hypothetical protein